MKMETTITLADVTLKRYIRGLKRNATSKLDQVENMHGGYVNDHITKTNHSFHKKLGLRLAQSMENSTGPVHYLS